MSVCSGFDTVHLRVPQAKRNYLLGWNYAYFVDWLPTIQTIGFEEILLVREKTITL